MTLFPIIQILSVLYNLSNGLSTINETNGTIPQLNGPLPASVSSSPLSSSVSSELQPHPLGHHPSKSSSVLSPSESSHQGGGSSSSHEFPYLMSRPVFTETLKSSIHSTEGQFAKSKESNSGWKQDDNDKWFKHGDEQGSDKQRNTKDQGSYTDGAHKKTLGHDNRNAAEKWKQGSESNGHEHEKLVEEYNKNKGRMYEKKWSWEKERGSRYGWGNQGHANQDHSKGSNLHEHESGLKVNQGKDAWSLDKKKSSGKDDSWGSKYHESGLKSEDKASQGKLAHGSKQWDDHRYNDKQFSYLGSF